jgi:hypothetical protein
MIPLVAPVWFAETVLYGVAVLASVKRLKSRSVGAIESAVPPGLRDPRTDPYPYPGNADGRRPCRAGHHRDSDEVHHPLGPNRFLVRMPVPPR